MLYFACSELSNIERNGINDNQFILEDLLCHIKSTEH